MSIDSYVPILNEELCCLEVETAHRLQNRQPDGGDILQFTETLKAMADPGRWKVLLFLREQELCVNDLATLMKSDQTQVSHQLKRLRLQGLVEYRKEGKMSLYRALPHPLLQALFQGFENRVPPGKMSLEA